MSGEQFPKPGLMSETRGGNFRRNKMINYIKLTNNGTSYILSYEDEVGEKLIPDITPAAFSNVQGVITYVETIKTQKDEEIENLKAVKTTLEEKNSRLTGYLLEIEMDDETMLELIDIFPMWSADSVGYLVGDRVRFEDKLYKVIQSHTSQSAWMPSLTPSLFVEVVPPEVIPEWRQPTGAHDAYNVGDKVTFEGVVYESVIAANTYSPSAYPAGWKTV